MHNNPREELEKELMALENKDEDFEAFYAKIYDEFGDKDADNDEDFLKDLLSEKPRRNEQPSGAAPHAYADEQKREVPAKKERTNRGLIFLIVLEVLGIAGVAAWWALHLL